MMQKYCPRCGKTKTADKFDDGIIRCKDCRVKDKQVKEQQKLEVFA
jgi:ribosomal protein L37AE/L43A